MKWDIKYKNSKYSIDEIVEKGEMFIQSIDGEHFDEDGVVYWRRKFPMYKIEYLRDYPNCKKMCEYKNELKRKLLSDDVVDIENDERIIKKNKMVDEIELGSNEMSDEIIIEI